MTRQAFVGAILAINACGVAKAPSVELRVTQSNVLRTDYVGSAVCLPCHAEIGARFASSAMHRMTRLAPGAELRAPFDGRALTVGPDVATLSQRGAERFITIKHAGKDLTGGELREFRVTKVIGGRHREDFAGVEVGNPNAVEMILPVSYLYRTGSLRYKGYSVMTPERPGLREGPVWKETCIFCHNTVPTLSLGFGGFGAKVHGYQGILVDRLLPLPRRVDFRIDNEAELKGALKTEIAFLGGSTGHSDLSSLLDDVALTTRAKFSTEHLVEVGIGCESCHGGSKEHVRNPKVHPNFLPVSGMFHLAGKATAPINAATAENRACARCHQVLFTGYPYTWEGGLRKDPVGGSHVNSGEGRDFLLGSCASAMRCSSCHDAHGGDDKRAKLETPLGDATCTTCHTKLASPAAAQSHTHHKPNESGGRCVGCHMPRKNMALDGSLSRYHRIGSPTDRVKVETDRPMECALCHPKSTVRSLLISMKDWWGKTYDEERIRELYGDLDADVLLETARRGKPHEQAVAFFILGEAHRTESRAVIEAARAVRYPLVRTYADDALLKLANPRAPSAK